MPVTTVLVIAFVASIFATFAAALEYGGRQTRKVAVSR